MIFDSPTQSKPSKPSWRSRHWRLQAFSPGGWNAKYTLNIEKLMFFSKKKFKMKLRELSLFGTVLIPFNPIKTCFSMQVFGD